MIFTFQLPELPEKLLSLMPRNRTPEAAAVMRAEVPTSNGVPLPMRAIRE